ELSEMDDDLAAAWSKLEAYTARFALIFQLCSWAAGEQYVSDQTIDEAAIVSAITLSDWFGGEARRVYGLFAESSEDRGQRELIDWIRRKGGRVTPREVKQAHRQFANVNEAEAALSDLFNAGFGTWDIVSTATKKRREFVLSTASTYTDSHESRERSENVYVDNVDVPHAHNGKAD
ncbi:MAG TPA: hypothetical protein VFW73_06970, partial [Lacipirellulaceae bacterium]|nr:hypothetical protein [Lacipirellulaceae bacterium]